MNGSSTHDDLFAPCREPSAEAGRDADASGGPHSVTRLRSEELFAERREIEIDHRGRIYRLRLTQLNKLILTA